MIGIDIGTKFIKACQVDIRGGEVHDIYSVVQELPYKKGTVSRSVKESALKKIMSRGKFSSRRAVISMGSTETVIRMAELPVMPEEELRNSIRFNAEKYIFTDLSQMDMDINILSTANNSVRVLVAAAPIKSVNEKMDIAQKAGCHVEISDVDNIALVNCFLKLMPEYGVESKSAAVINTGHSYTAISIINEGRLCFAKNIKFGGDVITEKIAQELDIKKGKAEKLKRNPEEWSEAGINVKDVIRKTTPDIIENLHRAVEYCRSSNLLDSVDKVYLTGGTSMLTEIPRIISDVLGIQAVSWNPLDCIAEKKDKEKGNGPLLAVVLGLALRGVKND